MAKRTREEEFNNERNCRPHFVRSLLSSAWNFFFGITSERPEEIESMENHEIAIEQPQKMNHENYYYLQKDVESSTPSRNQFDSAVRKNPIKVIRARKAEQEEDRYLQATLYSPNVEMSKSYGVPTSFPTERKTPISSPYIQHKEKEPYNTPYKTDFSAESSTKILTPRKSDLFSEEKSEDLNNISTEDDLNKLRVSSSAYQDKVNLLTQSLRARRVEEFRRKARKFLTPEQEAKVKQIYREKNREKIFITISNIDIKYEDLERILPGVWLNDELINCYMSIINDESKKIENNYPKVHCFNTFFNVMLLNNGKGYNYQRVAKWTKLIDIFALDYVIIPIHVGGNHWCLGVINFRDKRLEYYDSMGGKNPGCIKNLKQYVMDEHQAKKGTPIDMEDWTVYTPGHSIPQQNNAYDCGVFMCQFAESLASGNSVENVNQADMPYYRKRMMLEILSNNRHFDK